ncbi:TRAP transporter large permease [Sedimentibacter sp.]|uniref:TRAP transporter large permease n=1 Tax=Sedimentibacter sp. TaxID=1960295 RepID=UPI00289B8AF3|nr:TRAP transporter large permease [Sedimentibacter sp.]
MEALFILIAFFAMLFFGIPIAICLGGSALMYILLFANIPPIIVAQQMISSVDSFTLMAVPFFVMAGVLMEFGGISKRTIEFAKSLVGHYTGGLALVVVLSSVFFAAMTGSGVAATAAVGGIMIPAMVRTGYDSDFSCALQATAGIFGPLIPPSIAMVLYAVSASQSVSDMLVSGIGPGLLQSIMVATMAVIICRKRGFKGEGKFSLKNVLISFKESIWALIAPVIILGGIYSGTFTPTEASGIACLYSIIVGMFVYKEITYKTILPVLAKAMKSAAGIMLIVAASGAFSWVLTRERIPAMAAELFLGLTDSSIVFLFVVSIIVLIAGCFIDSIPIITIFTPIFYPIAQQYGISLIHLGAIMVTGTCIGLTTPPLGLNLFMASQIGKRPVHMVIKELIPFIIVVIIGLVVIILVPGISTWLPSLSK